MLSGLAVVGFSQACDMLVYALAIPVVPFKVCWPLARASCRRFLTLRLSCSSSATTTHRPRRDGCCSHSYVVVHTSFRRALKYAQSLSMIVATPPVSYFSERYHARRWPLILGLVALIASQALFMESTKLWMMILARVLQGISSTVVWVVALALLSVSCCSCKHMAN